MHSCREKAARGVTAVTFPVRQMPYLVAIPARGDFYLPPDDPARLLLLTINDCIWITLINSNPKA